MTPTEHKTGHRLRRVAWALLSLLAIALIAGVAVAEIRNAVLYAIAPRYARDANLVRLAKGSVDVLLLGTIHGKHLSTPAYGLAQLKAVIVHARPDLLLVEARPEELARGRWGDGPIEMPYAALWARQLGIAVDGVDWWQLSADRVRSTDEVRDDRIYQNLTKRLPAKGRVLVLIGYSHVPELAGRLIRDGFARPELPAQRKEELFAPLDEAFAYPRGMAQAIRQRIAVAESQAASAPAGVAQQFRTLAAARRAYLAEIERVGETGATPAPPRP